MPREALCRTVLHSGVRSYGSSSCSSLYPRGFAPRTPLHALSRAASPARSVRVARFAALTRIFSRVACLVSTLSTISTHDHDVMKRRHVLSTLGDDIRDHIERETRENIERGMAPEEARRQAILRFGNVALVTEDTRAVWGWQRLEQLAQDSGYAIRVLRRRPLYALLSVLTLALGIGGTAAVWGVAQGVLLSPLPYAHEREVGVFWLKTDWTHEEYLYIRGRTPGFRDVALYRQRLSILRSGAGAARLVPAVSASSELLDVLGATPFLGRGFQKGEDVPGAERVALLSFGLWLELGGDPSIIGTPVMLDGTPRTVIGVMPRGFWFPDPSVRIWTPEPLRQESRLWNSTLIGRVAPGQDIRCMDAPLSQLTAMLDERFNYSARRDKTRDRQIT